MDFTRRELQSTDQIIDFGANFARFAVLTRSGKILHKYTERIVGTAAPTTPPTPIVPNPQLEIIIPETLIEVVHKTTPVLPSYTGIIRCHDDEDHCIVCGKGGCLHYTGTGTLANRPFAFKAHFYHKKYNFSIFTSLDTKIPVLTFKDLVIDAVVISKTSYFLTVEDLVEDNAGVMRYNFAETTKEKNCHVRWTPKLPALIGVVRNRPLDVPEYYLDHVAYSKNLLVSSGFHGSIWVVDVSNLGNTISELKTTPYSNLGIKVGPVKGFDYNPNLNRAVTCSRLNKSIMCFSFNFGTKEHRHYFSLPNIPEL
jgi:hypothetical protein